MTKKKKAEELTDAGIAQRLFPKEVRREAKKVAKEPQPVEKQRVRKGKKG